jgi:hypothetical protein
VPVSRNLAAICSAFSAPVPNQLSISPLYTRFHHLS